MSSIFGWLKEWRKSGRRSFSVPLESRDRGLYYRALVRYEWRLNPDSTMPCPRDPGALVRDLLREELADVARNHRLLHSAIAEDAMNAVLCQTLWDDERRVQVEGSVRIRVAKQAKEAALCRAEEETALRTAYARETVELDLLLDRLSDPVLGPVWWVSRYADLQFAVGDPEKKVKSVLGAFGELQKNLYAARIDQITDEKRRVRRKIDEVFSVIEDEETLSLVLKVMNGTLERVGVRTIETGKIDLNESGRQAASDSPLTGLE
ncbi:hypothetical protein [Streptomyces sp. NPDC018059]|uniref:hypothetical protein n=1 Tax=Streptomyces sp. NPDC018059 TaxID=3365041 RepID=UPI0037A56674